jgi:hypothetical protein
VDDEEEPVSATHRRMMAEWTAGDQRRESCFAEVMAKSGTG